MSIIIIRLIPPLQHIPKNNYSIFKILMEKDSRVQHRHTNTAARNTQIIFRSTTNPLFCLIQRLIPIPFLLLTYSTSLSNVAKIEY